MSTLRNSYYKPSPVVLMGKLALPALEKFLPRQVFRAVYNGAFSVPSRQPVFVPDPAHQDGPWLGVWHRLHLACARPRDQPPAHPPALPRKQREGRAQPSDRPGGVLPPGDLPEPPGAPAHAPGVGARVQPPAPPSRPGGENPSGAAL